MSERAAAVMKTAEDLYERFGIVDPEQFVTEAANPGHPCHDYFEWDDGAAGVAYRVAQAKALIRSVKLNVAVADDLPDSMERRSFNVRAIWHVPERGFMPLNAVLEDTEAKTGVTEKIRAELESLRRRYAAWLHIVEAVAAEVFAAPEDGGD